MRARVGFVSLILVVFAASGAIAEAGGVGARVSDISDQSVLDGPGCRGTITLDRRVYRCSDVVGITLEDSDLMGTGASLVSISSSGDSHVETISLAEVPGGGGVFTGSIEIVERPWAIPGVSLGIGDGEQLTVSYVDSDACGVQGVLIEANADVSCCDHGELTLDRAVYRCQDVMVVTVRDRDLVGGTSGAVSVVSSADPDAAAVLVDLLPIPGSQDLFSGSVEIVEMPFVIPGVSVGVDDGATITASYNGGDAGCSGTSMLQASASIDCQSCVGQLSIDQETYTCDDLVGITLEDSDLAGLGSYDVSISASGDDHLETVTLHEISGSAGVLSGSIQIVERPWAIPGINLGVAHGEQITVSYLDDDACGSGNQLVEVSGNVDCMSCSAGHLSLDQIHYTCGDVVTMTLEDGDLAGAGTADVLISSSGDDQLETVTLQEVAGSAGVFSGTIQIVERPWAIPGVSLGVAHGELLTASYLDADACGTPGTTIEVYATVGCGGPGCHRGQISFDQSRYRCHDIVTISLVDEDLVGAQSEVVQVSASSSPDPMQVTLSAVPGHPGVLAGSVELDEGPLSIPGVTLGVEDGDRLIVVYLDDDDACPDSYRILDHASIDCQTCSGLLTLDRSTYACTDTILISLEDSDLAGLATVTVAASASGDQHTELVTLSADADDAGLFTGTLAIVGRPWAVPGVSLGVGDGETLTISYVDDDACGQVDDVVEVQAGVACDSVGSVVRLRPRRPVGGARR